MSIITVIPTQNIIESEKGDYATTDFSRHIRFRDCMHTELTYVHSVRLGSLYYCQKCKEFKKVSDIL